MDPPGRPSYATVRAVALAARYSWHSVPTDLSTDLVNRFRDSVAVLEAQFSDEQLDDDDVEELLHSWLDGVDQPLPWTRDDGITPDEWFFVTTLYGEMTMNGQRAHIRKYFPNAVRGSGKS